MRLLAPLFTLGLVFVGVPVLIHLFGRDRARRVTLPSARLLLAAQRRVSPHARIEQWILVALRALAVAAVAVVLSRPIWDRPLLVPSSASLKQAAVIVLDDSLSMARRDRRSTLYDEARATAQELVRAFPEGSEIAVLSTTDPARDPVGRLERDRSIVAQAISRASVSARTGATTHTLARAASLLSSASGQTRRVYLVSDLAAAGFDLERPRPFDVGTTPDAVGLEVLRVGDKTPPNDAVIAVEVAPAGDRAARRLRVTAHVRSDGRAAHGRTASLLVDGAPVARGIVSLSYNGVAEKRFEYAVPPDTEPRWVEVALDPDGDDALVLDDRRAAAVHGGGGRIVLVDGAPGASRREDETYYLETALRAARGPNAQLDVVHLDALASVDLHDVATVFLCNPRANGALGPLKSFVEDGGGLVVTVGDNLDAPALSSTMSGLLPSAIEGVRELSGVGGVAGNALRLSAPTPALLRRAPSLADERGRDAWLAARSYRVALLQPIPDGDRTREVLARFEDGSPALEERRVGRGHVLLLATTIDRGWSDLSIQPVFPAFIAELAEHAGSTRADAAEAEAIVVGQPATRPFARAAAGEKIEALLTTPAGARSELVIDPAHPSPLVVEKPGRYTLRPSRDGAAALTFAGVLDPDESDPRVLPDATRLTTKSPASGPGHAPPLELWHVIAGALLALLLAEAALGLRG